MSGWHGDKTPERVLIVESLPKNASGKTLKRDLRTSLSSLDDDPAG